MNQSKKRLRFALVGCGRIAQRHAEHIRRTGDLAAACDVKMEKAQALTDTCDAVPFTDLKKMLDSAEIDVVSVCSPNGLHAEHTIRALQANCHVLCEKPMALSARDCGEMIHQAERASRRLFVVKQNRFNPPVVAVKKLLERGGLGNISSVQLNCFWNRNENYYRNSWKGSRDLDGGCLFTQFSHFIDLLYWLIGDVTAAQAFIANRDHQEIIEFEDCGVVALEFASGVLGTVHFTINSHAKNMEGSITIFGDKGTVKIGGQYLNELEYQNLAEGSIGHLPPGRPANQYGEYVGSMSNHDRVYENVVDVLTNDGIIATHGYEGLKTVEIIEKIYTAATEQWNPQSHTPVLKMYPSVKMSA
ncbi:MAG: oxidoreductase [Planctomycetaceae bacterium]|nr:oxidoreductase [Planctomycetaceae bacterium]|tara:strand:- start:13577 stop:14656 length:1080 start_codon:yes stop_codon:yes gene_type:complete